MFISCSFHIHFMFISDFTELQKTTCWSCWQRLGSDGSDGSDGASGTAASAAAAASARACYRLRITEDDSGWLRINLDMSWHVLTFFIFLHIFLHISSFSISEELTRPAVLPLCWPKVPVSQNSSQTAEGLWRLMKAYEGLWRLMKAYEGLWRLRRSASCATPGLFSTSLSSLSSFASCEEKCLCHVQNDASDAAKCKSIHIPFCKVDEIGTFSSVRVILSAPVALPVVLLPHAVTSVTQAELRPASWHLLRSLRLPRQNHRDLHPKSSKTDMNMSYAVIYIYMICHGMSSLPQDVSVYSKSKLNHVGSRHPVKPAIGESELVTEEPTWADLKNSPWQNHHAISR